MLERLKRPTPWNAYLFLVAVMATWAGNHVLGKWANGHIPPMTLSFFRWSLAGLIMLPLAWSSLMKDRAIIAENWPRLLLLALLGSGYYNTLQYIALTETSVTNAAILNSWAPVLIAGAGAVVFGDHLRRSQIGGLMLSLAGVLVIILRGDLAALATLSFNRGDLVMLFATGMWALYTTLLRIRPPISTLSFAGLTYAIAGLANLPLAAYEHSNGQHVDWSWGVVAAIGYAGILASVIAYSLYTRSVEIIGATRTGAFIHLIPLFASLMAVVLLGEQPALYHAAGFLMILTGVWIVARPASTPACPA
ncbi:MAG: DMT family transporter [Hyphomicrobium sp.]